MILVLIVWERFDGCELLLLLVVGLLTVMF